jgi:hypothetical protein
MLFFAYINNQVPTYELNHQRLEDIFFDLLQSILSIAKQFLLLELVGSSFGL